MKSEYNQIEIIRTDLRRLESHEFNVNHFCKRENIEIIKIENHIVQPSYSVGGDYHPDLVTIIIYKIIEVRHEIGI